MLKSLHRSASKSLISVIHPQIAYCTSNKDKREKLLRTRSEQKQLYGSVIRDGEDVSGKNVIDDKNVENTQPAPQFDGIERLNTSKDEMVVSSHTASEFYWLVQSQSASKNIKIFKAAKSQRSNDAVSTGSKKAKDSHPKKPPSSSSSSESNSESAGGQLTPNSSTNDTHTVPMSQNSIINPKSAIISAKNLLQQFMQSKRTNPEHKKPQTIPFNDETLNSIVNYPLVCEKSPLSQTQELISDRSLRLPSISKVLQATMPESARIALRKWKLGKIAELGVDGFKQYEQETLNRGKDFHSAIEEFLNRGEVPARDSSIIQLWDSIDSSLHTLKLKSVLSEQPILHADLKYKGIIDNVSIVKDVLTAFEWKTSEKSKPRLTSTYDAPVQLCAYLGALNADPRYDLTVKNGYVIVAYTNGNAANVFKLSEADLRKYWLLWLQRLQEYWIRVRDGTLPDPV